MLDDNKGHSTVGRAGSEKSAERFNTPSRGADANYRKGKIGALLRPHGRTGKGMRIRTSHLLRGIEAIVVQNPPFIRPAVSRQVEQFAGQAQTTSVMIPRG